jgi:uncharacterized membrane protein YbhN (UPF0104 family)
MPAVDHLRQHPRAVMAVAIGLAAAAVIAIAIAWGPGAALRAFSEPRWGWLAIAAAGTLLAPVVYVVPYRIIAQLDVGHDLSEGRLARAVVAGFAPFAPAGGFALDQRVLHQVYGSQREATVRVLGLGALEWALLAPAAWVAAIVLLVSGDPRPMPSLLWPWIILVPVGFAAGLGFAHRGHQRGWTKGGPGWREPVARGLRGIHILVELARGGASGPVAWLGMALYWGLDIAGFLGAIRFIGLPSNIGEVVVAYATGYALTRRTMPLGGAGITEVLMTLALHWAGQPIPAALAAVVIYRVFNLLLPAAPALLVTPRVERSLRGGAKPHGSRSAAT